MNFTVREVSYQKRGFWCGSQDDVVLKNSCDHIFNNDRSASIRDVLLTVGTPQVYSHFLVSVILNVKTL